MSEYLVEGELLHIRSFSETQRAHLEETNQIIARSSARGNVTYAVQSLEFALPVREVVTEGKPELFVRLRGKMAPGDKLLRVRIPPRLSTR